MRALPPRCASTPGMAGPRQEPTGRQGKVDGRAAWPPPGLASQGHKRAWNAIPGPLPEAATMGPTALARAPRLRSVPMIVPFCLGKPVGEGGEDAVGCLLPGFERALLAAPRAPRPRRGPITGPACRGTPGGAGGEEAVGCLLVSSHLGGLGQRKAPYHSQRPRRTSRAPQRQRLPGDTSKVAGSLQVMPGGL